MFRQLVTVACLLAVTMAAPKPAIYYTADYPVYAGPVAAAYTAPLATTYAAPLGYAAYAPYAAYSSYSYSLTSPYTAAYIVQ